MRNVLMAISGGVGRERKGFCEPGVPVGVSTAVRLARLPDLEAILLRRLAGRLLFDILW